MKKETTKRVLHRCECSDCLGHPNGTIARSHRAINRVLAHTDECSRRLFAGLLAQQHGRGGIALLERVTGLDRNTIARGLRELRRKDNLPAGKVRQRGAGRKKSEVQHPGS